MSVTCTRCGRTPTDRIEVRGVLWEPRLKETRPGVWRCWKCRSEPHPDMPESYIPDSFKQKHFPDYEPARA